MDGKNGPDDPNTSMSILLKWLTTESNYNKYRGGPTSQGKGKTHWCTVISEQIKDAGVRVYRNPNAIKCKISNLETSFKQAHDWVHGTGAGVRENEPTAFNDYVKQLCPYYFDLLEVMQDRATARPQLTSDAINSEDEGPNSATPEVIGTMNSPGEDDSSTGSSPLPTLQRNRGNGAIDDASGTSRSFASLPPVPATITRRDGAVDDNSVALTTNRATPPQSSSGSKHGRARGKSSEDQNGYCVYLPSEPTQF